MIYYIKKIIYLIYRLLFSKILIYFNQVQVNSIKMGYRSRSAAVSGPSYIVGAKNVFLHDYTSLQGHHTILSYTAKFIMKKYSGSAVGLTVVTGNHVPTVGIPQYLLGTSHINDREEDVIVEEDVWIGTGVTLLAGSHVGRGSVVGAKALITRKSLVPPYSVVVGSPSRIIAAKFTIEQILNHELKLYKPDERLSREELEELFMTYYKDKPTLGVDFNISSEEECKLLNLIKKQNFKYPNSN